MRNLNKRYRPKIDSKRLWCLQAQTHTACQIGLTVISRSSPTLGVTGASSDWYPQYRLVCQAIPSEPRSRALILSALLANIQDVFNEYGVQIMSPQYFADPVAPKLVPPDQWFTAPAVKPDTG